MDIIWMLALGGMNLLCVLTGARIARKTNRRAPRSAASHRNSRDAQDCAWPKPPLCKGRWLPEGQTEGLTAEMWAPGNPPGEKSLIFHPAPFAQGGHGGAAKGFTQGGHEGAAKGFTQGGHGSGSGFTQGGHGSGSGFAQGVNRGAELTPQEKQLQTIWHNIERYDGTAAGQKEVTENFGFT